MRRATIIICFLTSVLVANSCIKNNRHEDESEKIVFLIEEVQPEAISAIPTKTLLNDASLKSPGSRLHVMDVLSGFTGTASWYANDLYINDEVEYEAGNPIWQYTSGRIYPWTTDGVHRFFGWLSFDINYPSLNALRPEDVGMTADYFFNTTLANNFSAANATLTIPALEMRADTTITPQYDFMYASTSNYIMPHTDNLPVRLQMQHLFSAISLRLLSETPEPVLIHDVTVIGLKNKKSAVINFDSTPTLTTHHSYRRQQFCPCSR